MGIIYIKVGLITLERMISSMENKKKYMIWGICIALPLVLLMFSLFIGRYDFTFGEIVDILIHPSEWKNDPSRSIQYSVIYDMRLPRCLMAFVVGGALAISGGAQQSMFRNPLVDSGMLGVSAGAGFGACLAIVAFGDNFMIYLCAFIFGILAMMLSCLVGKIYDTSPTVTLVLGGVVVSSIFNALVSFLKFVADPLEKLPTITFWLMGSLQRANFKDLLLVLIPIVPSIIVMLLLRWRLNVLSLGEKEASSLGVDVKMVRALMMISTSIATAAAVCVSGTIGWIGLIVPHIVRMIVGNDNRALLPASLLIGGSFLMAVDLLARSITSAEVPIGVLTAIIGGPFFVLILKKTKGGGSW